MEHLLSWFEEKNPLEALRLAAIVGGKVFHFPQVSFDLPEDIEVLYIAKVQRCFAKILPFLEKGGRVVFVEENRERLYAFLQLPEFVPHKNLFIIAPEEIQYQKIAWDNVFRKALFIGSLPALKEWIDGVHMALSDYRLLGEEILPNMQANLLYTTPFIDGRSLEGVYKGVPAVIACAGPSLETSFSSLKICAGRAVVLGVGSAIPRLQAAAIPFDYGVCIDPNPPLQKGSFPLFYQGRVSERLFAAHEGQKIWMGNSTGWPIEAWLYRESGINPWEFSTGWNAGTFAVEIASFLGCAPIIVLGMDGGSSRDLDAGVEWIKKMPRIVQEEGWLARIGEKRVPTVNFKEEEIDKAKVLENLVRLNDLSLQQEIAQFLALPTPDKRDRLLLEITLMEHPLYTHFLEPLWKLFRPLYGQPEEFISALLFYQRALAWQDKHTFRTECGFFFRGKKEGTFVRRYPSGELYGIEQYKKGKREGEWSLQTADGKPLSIVHYKEGRCHGAYTLYNATGKIREEMYVDGKLLYNS